MAVNNIAICNLALGHLGRTASAIQSLTERSTEARLCGIWYDQCRQQVLEAHDWSFARARVALPLHSDAPPAEWAFRYQVPSDMLAIRRVWNPYTAAVGNYGYLPFQFQGIGGISGDNIPYQLETSLNGQTLTLLTNLDSALLIYTRDQTLVQMFSPLFVKALSHFLASSIATGLTGNPTLEKKEADAFQVAMMAATASDANQGTEPPIRDAYTVRARL